MLPRDILQQVRRIHIRTSRLVDDVLAGAYHSTFKGRGMDFDEVREYMPGDEVRTIDWNVTARRGQPYVKRYVEERELTVMLLVDLSASGQFGSVLRLKTEIATELCAVLAWSAIRNYDKVGLILFTDHIEKFLPPQKGRRHVLRVIREVLYFQPQGRRTEVGRALEYLRTISRRRTVSFLVSDFLELSLPRLGFLELQDLETGAHIVVDTASSAVRQAYAQRRAAAVERRRQLFQTLGISAIEVRTDEPYIHPLMRFFRQRERRR